VLRQVSLIGFLFRKDKHVNRLARRWQSECRANLSLQLRQFRQYRSVHLQRMIRMPNEHARRSLIGPRGDGA
jgi:hypothetical protein